MIKKRKRGKVASESEGRSQDTCHLRLCKWKADLQEDVRHAMQDALGAWRSDAGLVHAFDSVMSVDRPNLWRKTCDRRATALQSRPGFVSRSRAS